MAPAGHIKSLTSLQFFAALRVARLRYWAHLAVAAAPALAAVLYLASSANAFYPLTRGATAWGALRIAAYLALGCAIRLAGRGGVADSRKAFAGAAFFTVAVIAGACLPASDALIVSGFAGLFVSLSQVSKLGPVRLSRLTFVYLREITCEIYVVRIAWGVLFINAAVKSGLFSDEQLSSLLSMILLVTLALVAAAGHHLIEKPERWRVKLCRQSRPSHNFATANAW